MRVVLIVSTLILINAESFGQAYKISGYVRDAENLNALPFANIMVLNEPNGVSTDKNGYFMLVLKDPNKVDTMVISYVGYESRSILITYGFNDTIFLTPHTYDLSEVKIGTETRKSHQITLHKFKTKNCSVLYSRGPFGGGGTLFVPIRSREPSIEAMYFPNEIETNSLNSIKAVRIFLTNYNTTPSLCRLRIFESTEHSTPGRDMIGETIDISVSKSQLVEINLEKYNLAFPDDGIFVGIELLIIPENSWVARSNNNISTVVYSPFLNYVPTTEFEYTFWLYTEGKWIPYHQSIPEYTNKVRNLYYKPAISLVLSN